MIEQRVTFASTVANAFVRQNMQKSFFNYQYIDPGLCRSACLYYFQQFSLLGRVYSEKALRFIYVIGGQSGEEIDILQKHKNAIDTWITPLITDKSKFGDLVCLMDGTIKNNLDTFPYKYGMKKISAAVACKTITSWGMYGACLGLSHPSTVVSLYNSTYSSPDSDLWSHAYKLGIVTTPQPEHLTIEQSEGVIKQLFYEFCSRYYPELLSILFPTIDPAQQTKKVAIESTALTTLKAAADNEDIWAEFQLGRLYDSTSESTEHSIIKDDIKAAIWYRKAAVQGFELAQNNLGDLYKKGKGIQQNYTLAAAWYQKAADQGYAPAWNSLGSLYANGHGVPRDYVQAIKNLVLAKLGRRPELGSELTKVELQATASQVAEGHRLANEQIAKWHRNEILLDCGITVKIMALYLDETYGGLLEGRPDKNLNQEIVDNLCKTTTKLWRERNIHVITPMIKYRYASPYLPQYAFAAWLMSYEPSMSDLVVIWFSDLDQNMDFHFPVKDYIKSIKWKELAKEFDP